MDIPAGDGPGQRFAFSGDGYYLKSAGRDARAVGRQVRPARGLRQHAARSPSAATSPSPRATARSCRASPAPRARTRTPGWSRRSSAASRVRYPGGIPDAVAQAGRVRGRRHHPDGVPRLLPRRRRLHQLGQGQRHPGRPGPRVGCRLDGRLRDADHRPRPAGPRPDLRAVPQPRPRLDARLRHRLRRASARRGHPLRHRQVRRRPGLLHRHLRHHQGQAGRQGLLAGSWATPSRWATGSPRRCRPR